MDQVGVCGSHLSGSQRKRQQLRLMTDNLKGTLKTVHFNYLYFIKIKARNALSKLHISVAKTKVLTGSQETVARDLL